MTIRILADREPYSSYADLPPEDGKNSPRGSVSDALVVLNGPSSLDAAAPDIIVLPAAEFLSLSPCSVSSLHQGMSYIAYGPVDLMTRAFDQGCTDYIREPWSYPELLARIEHLRRLKFCVGGQTFELKGSSLFGDTATIGLSEDERVLLRLLLLNSPLPVPHEAAISSFCSPTHGGIHALRRSINSLRKKLDEIEPDLSNRLHTIRGLGYRFDVAICG